MSGFPGVNGVEVLLAPPEGYMVDLAHPQRNGEHGAYWAYGIGTFLAVLFVGQRVFTRVFIGNGLQIDDGFVVLSMICSQVTQIILILQDLPTCEFSTIIFAHIATSTNMDKLSWIGPWIYVLCGSFAKLSLLVVYLRLSPGGWFLEWSWVAVGGVVVHTIVLVFLMIFICNPVSKSWNITIPVTEGSCINAVALYFATAIANIITDVMVMVLPIPLILKLQMPKWQKIGVMAVFPFASVTVVTSIIRCAALPALLGNDDQTWAISQASLWAIIEANLVIICASVTTLKKFLSYIAPGMMLGSSGVKSSQNPTCNPPTISKLTSRRPDRYADFGDDTELYPIGNQTEVVAGGNDRSETGSWDTNSRLEDNTSGKGIIRTTAVKVS
ncbi:putative Integral membrane protein [Seiridium cardinale]|uniref:Integral membrane protein n=1 Tax=Seiridium cardinale TaxID=138064 RepID=A0ABR2XKI4_9PEZI